GYAFNDTLQIGQLHDPFTSVDPDEQKNTPIFQTYRKLLAVSGSDAIGEVTYPRLGIGLPVYHGTSDTVISKGVGHMFGSSLPIGGPSTHSVLTAHSGLAHANLFTHLLDAKVGDIFWISVLGEDHYYEVQSIETVLPDNTDSLQIVEGQDLVTLFTCAPIGINSHRFMVHAERISNPESSGMQEIAGDGSNAGFPWWSLWFLLSSGALALMIFAPARQKPIK
ncbi:MAG TPA: class C sortase, partial [Microbacteriaceae bacterium]|nr:class C sortase [Microbacteriaceae bacterium]